VEWLLKPLTLWQQHVQDWSGCQRCELSRTRHRVVLGKGQVPCDVLLIGEAPGHSEDAIGEPFVGPSGQLLDVIVKQSVPAGIRLAYTNLIACIPLGEDGIKTHDPPVEAIEACKLRLTGFIHLANPRLIVCVGTVARDWLNPGYQDGVKIARSIPQVWIQHPGWTIRQPLAMRGLLVQRSAETIREAIVAVMTPQKEKEDG